MAFPKIVKPDEATRAKARQVLNIPPDHKVILALDGGGMRGILSIQLLKTLESIAGVPAWAVFDMVAGTSTGGIIAALLATGHDAAACERTYDELVKLVFKKRPLGDRFLNPPRFSKSAFRDMARRIFANQTLADACRHTGTDLLITSKDMAAGEETFFSCFLHEDGNIHGTYAPVLLRAAVEATMSAPTYFTPLERFVDGGTTTYNNPSSAAIIEALNYSGNDGYDHGKVTVISLGTGISPQFVPPGHALDPKGPDIRFWLNWLMTEMGQDASDMQTDLLRGPRFRRLVDYRRFQISFDPHALNQLPNLKFDPPLHGFYWLHDVDYKTLSDIDMSDTSKYELVKAIGRQMGAYIAQENRFGADLVFKNKVRDVLVSARGDVDTIRRQLSDPAWLDAQPK